MLSPSWNPMGDGAGARIDLDWCASGGGLCVRHRVLGCAPEDMGGAAVKEDRGVGPASSIPSAGEP